MTQSEKQLISTIKSLVNVLQMVKIYTPSDINNLIQQHVEITEDIIKIKENE